MSMIEENKQIIRQWLRTAPPDWKSQFRSGMSQRGRLELGSSSSLTIENALLILGITAGGNYSGDKASGRNKVPDAVRLEAMHGLELSHEFNYGAWNFIGIARAIQLATQPGVPDETIRRMKNYFTRHEKDKRSSNFGNDNNPSRGYMAWLNWGGDAGQAWVNHLMG